MARKERRPGQGRRSPGGRGSAAQWRPTRERGGMNPAVPVEVRSALARKAQVVGGRSDLRLFQVGRQIPRASPALNRLPSPWPASYRGRCHASGKGASRRTHGRHGLRGPPSKDGERSRKSARIVAALGRQRATIRVPCSCGECVPVAYATPARENAGRSEEAALGDKPSAYRAREGRIDVRRRRAALASGDCPGSHRGPGRGERRNRSVWKSRNDRRYV